eukprot:TRINITY_DN629_c0_g1_i2.p2 TRINITY_DN629_c0_g1~~TRINITY_DN629_c0_g1_i2.p2  ORF type:complete len:103 (-),score=35.89 TRINITY_DN629_c0_g1_i2:786-1094(-)
MIYREDDEEDLPQQNETGTMVVHEIPPKKSEDRPKFMEYFQNITKSPKPSTEIAGMPKELEGLPLEVLETQLVRLGRDMEEEISLIKERYKKRIGNCGGSCG